MAFTQQCVVFGIKASKGVIEGREYDSCTFHIQTEINENSSGKGLGFTIAPFKCGTSAELDKWSHLASSFPLKAEAQMEIRGNGKGASELVLVSIKPIERTPAVK